MIKDSLIVGHSLLRNISSYDVVTSDQSRCTLNGIWLPYSSRLTVSNVTFVNFDEDRCRVFGTCAHCKFNDGGAIVRTSNLTLLNSPNLIAFPFPGSTLIEDQDGTLTGFAGGSVLPEMAILDPEVCRTRPDVSLGSTLGVVCKHGRYAKVAWNSVYPTSTVGKNAYFENEFGRYKVSFRAKAKSFANGYTAFLPTNTGAPIELSFENSAQLTNISYKMAIYELQSGDFVYLKHLFKQQPDYFSTTHGFNNRTVGQIPDPWANKHGSWFFDPDSRNMTFLISGKGNQAEQPSPKFIDYRVYRCFYENCQAPTRAPLPSGKPNATRKWSVSADWRGAPEGFGGADGNIPKDNDDVMINSDWWMIVDMTSPLTLNRLYVDGVLEFDANLNHQVKANLIFVRGILRAGWPNKPILNNVYIGLMGDHGSPDLPLSNGPNVGAKAFGVFGLLHLHGKKHNIHWTRLARNLTKSENLLRLAEAVDWEPGQEIIITTSDFESRHAEKFIIKTISKDNLTIELDRSANYTHSAFRSTINGYLVNMSAKVALLSRNIRIEGLDEPAGSLTAQSFGCRVLVGAYTQDGILYSGNAQLSEVQFKHCGQLGWSETYDPR